VSGFAPRDRLRTLAAGGCCRTPPTASFLYDINRASFIPFLLPALFENLFDARPSPVKSRTRAGTRVTGKGTAAWHRSIRYVRHALFLPGNSIVLALQRVASRTVRVCMSTTHVLAAESGTVAVRVTSVADGEAQRERASPTLR
jgi:hypothetical protein